MTLEVTEPVPRDRPAENDHQAAAKLLDESSLLDACSVYMIMLLGRNGNHLRKPYLSLHSARQALQRAQDRGQQAHLVLCRVEPVAVADLADLDGGEQR
jgi:hypothetical protein